MSPSTAIRRDAAVIIIEGDEFLFLDRARVKEMLAWPTLLEMRNIYPIKTMKALGFRYVYVARPVAGFGGEGGAGNARRRGPNRHGGAPPCSKCFPVRTNQFPARRSREFASNAPNSPANFLDAFIHSTGKMRSSLFLSLFAGNDVVSDGTEHCG